MPLTKRQKNEIMSIISRTLSTTGTIISMMNINKMCKEVETAVESGEDAATAAARIVPTYNEA